MSSRDPGRRESVAEILDDIRNEALPNLEVALIGGMNELAEDLQRIERNQEDIARAVAASAGGGGAAAAGRIVETDVEENASLPNGDTMRLRLDGAEVVEADFAGFLVDDGDNGDPESYDFQIDHWNSEDNDWMQWVSDTTVTTRAHGDTEFPERIRFSLTKNSAGSATYRIFGFAKVTP